MKRKFFEVLIVCVLMIAMFTSCNFTEKPLVECGEEVISLMAEMVESDEYISLKVPSGFYEKAINNLRKGDYSKSSSVYEITIPFDKLFITNIDKEDFSDELYQYVCSEAYQMFVSSINSACNIEALSASAVFSTQKSFVSKSMNKNKIYLYVFEDGLPIIVTFLADGEGSFRAAGNFIFNDNLVTDDENSIKNSLESFGMKDVTVEKR